jgi:hypothetical protein
MPWIKPRARPDFFLSSHGRIGEEYLAGKQSRRETSSGAPIPEPGIENHWVSRSWLGAGGTPELWQRRRALTAPHRPVGRKYRCAPGNTQDCASQCNNYIQRKTTHQRVVAANKRRFCFSLFLGMRFSKFNPVSEKKRKARIRDWVANATPAIAGTNLRQASLRFCRYKAISSFVWLFPR